MNNLLLSTKAELLNPTSIGLSLASFIIAIPVYRSETRQYFVDRMEVYDTIYDT